MPLKALIDGKEVQSWRLSGDEWKNLVAASKRHQITLTMCCCGARAIPRKGSRIPHFAHYRRPDNCNHKDESKEHEEAKSIIARACQEAGYEVDTEVSGPGYEADVMALKDGKKTAFEVQLSYQTLDVTEERRKRYKNDNVRDIWLFKKMPAGRDGRTPRFHTLNIDGKLFTVKHRDGNLTLTEFVKKALQTKSKPAEIYQMADFEPYEISDEPVHDRLLIADWLWKHKYYILGIGLIIWLFSLFRRR